MLRTEPGRAKTGRAEAEAKLLEAIALQRKSKEQLAQNATAAATPPGQAVGMG